jgi:hypothetical protein
LGRVRVERLTDHRDREAVELADKRRRIPIPSCPRPTGHASSDAQCQLVDIAAHILEINPSGRCLGRLEERRVQLPALRISEQRGAFAVQELDPGRFDSQRNVMQTQVAVHDSVLVQESHGVGQFRQQRDPCQTIPEI